VHPPRVTGPCLWQNCQASSFRGRVILLVACDKSGQWTRWYRAAIPQAEQMYADYLAEREKEMGL